MRISYARTWQRKDGRSRSRRSQFSIVPASRRPSTLTGTSGSLPTATRCPFLTKQNGGRASPPGPSLQLHTWPRHEQALAPHISFALVDFAALHHEYDFFHDRDVPPAGRPALRRYLQTFPVRAFQFHPSVLTTRLHSPSPLAARRSASCLRSPAPQILSTQSLRRRRCHSRFSDGAPVPA